jgi:hypothetical protein
MDQFIEQLLREQGAPDDLEPAVRQDLVEDLAARATEFLNRRLIDAMDDTSVEEFSKLLDVEPADPQAIQEFIATHVPDKERVVTEALLEFRSIYLGSKA